MTPEQFVYWMQGFAELNESPPSPEQWKSIREHLKLVFDKKTPDALQFGHMQKEQEDMRLQKRWEYAAESIGRAPALKC